MRLPLGYHRLVQNDILHKNIVNRSQELEKFSKILYTFATLHEDFCQRLHVCVCVCIYIDSYMCRGK